MEFNIIKDLKSLTNISESILNKLTDISSWIICNNIEENIRDSNDFLELDIGIGVLIINTVEDNIKYKFIPSKQLENGVRDTLCNHKNPLTLNLEQSLAKKITSVYKELM